MESMILYGFGEEGGITVGEDLVINSDAIVC